MALTQNYFAIQIIFNTCTELYASTSYILICFEMSCLKHVELLYKNFNIESHKFSDIFIYFS